MLTIDKAIEQLEKLRAEIGGASALVTCTSGTYVRTIKQIGTASVGKGDASKFVSRGGVPVALVVIT